MTKVLTICNRKGGVGKTTTSVTLSSILATKFKGRILAIDADSQRNLTTWLEAELSPDKPSLYDVLVNDDCNIADAVVKTRIPNVYVVPGTSNLAKVSSESFNTSYPQGIIERKLKSIKNKFDYIIIDCAPAVNIITIASLVASDAFLVPAELADNSLSGVRSIFSLVEDLKKNGIKSPKSLGILICRYEKPNAFEVRRFLEILKKEFSGNVLDDMIPASVKLVEAENSKQTIFEKYPDHPATKAYIKIATKLSEALL